MLHQADRDRPLPRHRAALEGAVPQSSAAREPRDADARTPRARGQAATPSPCRPALEPPARPRASPWRRDEVARPSTRAVAPASHRMARSAGHAPGHPRCPAWRSAPGPRAAGESLWQASSSSRSPSRIRGMPSKASIAAPASSALLPSHDGGDRVIPDRADDGAGDAGDPPGAAVAEQYRGDADIRDRAEAAHGREG